MLIRALIVVLSVLNLGVALWWMTRGEPPAPQAATAEAGVATLELLPSATTTVQPSPAVAPPAAAEETLATTSSGAGSEPGPESMPGQCLSLGPFVDRARAQAAAARLAGTVTRSRLREVPANQPADYRVWIAPAASHQEAQAMAKRIVEAGFSDYYVISQGEGANAVALGQYRNREGAERRVAALKAVGFPATLMPGSDEVAASWWIDAALASASPAAALAQRSGAAQQQSLDCARLR